MTAVVPPAAASGRRVRAVLIAALAALAAAAWQWLLPMHMAPMSVLRLDMPAGPIVWSVMMAAMMISSALAMISVHDRVTRARSSAHPLASTVAFAAAYLIVWIGFSALVTAVQWQLERGGLMSDMMASANAWLSGGLLIVAGLFQWSPLKHACLGKCRSPIAFILNEWRPGIGGALVAGLRHGIYCLGCCWALMALLFVFGTMNLAAAAALAVLVLAEKMLPWGHRIARGAGVVFVALGGWLVAAAIAG